jgi:hypothetical protein
MRMIWKGALLGGVVGAAVVAAKSLQNDEPNDVVASKIARTAGGAAVAGGAIGFVLDGRAKRKAARTRRLPQALSAAGLLETAAKAAELAQPRVERAAGRTREAAHRAAEAARPQLEHAAEVARVQAHHIAEAARPRLAELAESAKPRLAELADRIDAPTVVLVR